MQPWSPFWRWLATGVLAVTTIVWVAHSQGSAREAQFAVHRSGSMMHGMPGMTGSGATIVGGNPTISAAQQRQRAQLQRQEAELQAQQAQLNARLAALQARVSSLGQ
ncbi:MAG TPA: hypothetical protein VIU62_04100 [Chloroflexota bacterium]